MSVTSGVPQGSILGPILFSIYLSSYQCISSSVHAVKYADDVSLIVPVYKDNFDDSSLVDDEIKNFEKWCKDHEMIINLSKTKVLTINFGCTPLPSIPHFENVSVLKVLGLYFNEKLTWSDHLDFLVKKVSQRLYVLRILKSLLTHDQLVSVFYAIIQSLLDYASPVFLNPGVNFDSQILSLCKRAFRIIHGQDCHFC